MHIDRTTQEQSLISNGFPARLKGVAKGRICSGCIQRAILGPEETQKQPHEHDVNEEDHFEGQVGPEPAAHEVADVEQHQQADEGGHDAEELGRGQDVVAHKFPLLVDHVARLQKRNAAIPLLVVAPLEDHERAQLRQQHHVLHVRPDGDVSGRQLVYFPQGEFGTFRNVAREGAYLDGVEEDPAITHNPGPWDTNQTGFEWLKALWCFTT